MNKRSGGWSFFVVPHTRGWEDPKTSLDELDKVERHLNREKTLADWLSIRVYEPEREEGVVVWRLK